MKKSHIVVTILSILLFGICPPTVTSASPDKIRLRVASAIPTKLPVMEPIVSSFNQLALISNGTVQAKMYEPGKIVPVFQIQEAVSKKQIEAGWSAAVYLSGQIPAAALFTSIPFGPTAIEYMTWFYYGNGRKLYQEMYDHYGFNVKVIPMSINPMEGGGWFKKPINSIDDLKGLRLRWPGYGGKILSKFGASISTIPAGEIFPALERSVIDGTEMAGPYFDSFMGFHKVAKYSYYPGWHQTSSCMELTINKDVWNKMSQSQQEQIELSALQATVMSALQYESQNGQVIKTNAQKKGVTNMHYPPEVLEALQNAWLEFVAQESAKDPFFKKVWDDLNSFMQNHQVWEDNSYTLLPPQKF